MARTTSPLAKRIIGWLAYVPPIARSLLANRALGLTYRIDGGRTRAARAHTVIIGNCGTLTGGMLLPPGAAPDDGLLDVVMPRPARRLGWARIGTRLTAQGIAHRSRLGRSMLRLAPGRAPWSTPRGGSSRPASRSPARCGSTGTAQDSHAGPGSVSATMRAGMRRWGTGLSRSPEPSHCSDSNFLAQAEPMGFASATMIPKRSPAISATSVRATRRSCSGEWARRRTPSSRILGKESVRPR
ncbi:hypothetical protein [Brachybacterium sp. GPGPB12]|uniref:diacylglycerol/lipid kinase family protein n=1 Tax=Brachybacterium sp. GPGPB12 TaxID=3023517 RepID=UPI0031345060